MIIVKINKEEMFIPWKTTNHLGPKPIKGGRPPKDKREIIKEFFLVVLVNLEILAKELMLEFFKIITIISSIAAYKVK